VSAKYEPELYRRFAEDLKFAVTGKNIKHADMDYLRKHAVEHGYKLANGGYRWSSAVSSRMAQKTVMLGSEPVQLPRLNDAQVKIINDAPDELHKVLHCLRTMPFVHIRRQMGDNAEFNPVCDMYTSVADPKNIRIAYCWANTMRDYRKRSPGPNFTMIHIPDEHSLRMQVLSLPEHNLNLALGTDYTGEQKKGMLRQGMYRADLAGMLGLHAGTKLVVARDARDGKLKKYAVFMFGLTATGKSTWSCHDLHMDWRDGEETFVVQDDIVFLKRDGSSYGSEQNFYVKTDCRKELQEAMYWALTDKSALLENVMINAAGEPDFLDERLGENGRAVVFRNKLRVDRGGKLKGIAYESINTPSLEELDGIVFAFITRRNTMMAFGHELTPEQGVLAYLFGESTHSFATRPELAGESTRIVGMDDFIVGPQGRKVNTFYDIVMDLCARYPGKVRFFQYNTGGMGEIIKVENVGGKPVRKLIRKVDRVPLNLMAALQRGHLRGTNKHQKGLFGTSEVVECVGADVKAMNPRNFYSQAEIEEYLRDIIEGRRRHVEQITKEGLRPEIVKLAEQSFEECGGGGAKKAQVAIPADVTNPPEAKKREMPAEERVVLPPSPAASPWLTSWEPRPPRSSGSRWK
jgi:phosphoenolpyruvate carboxykinase (ATP)